MKKIVILSLFITAIAFTSCTAEYKKEIERLQAVTDSLKEASVEKDTISMAYIKAFNEIQHNLDEIKMKERLITQISDGDPELRNSRVAEINRDIEAIYELLLKNKKIVEDLRNQVRKAGVKNSELEKMIDNLSDQIQLKDTQISQLKDDLSKKNVEIQNLELNLAAMEAIGLEKAAVIEKQVIERNTVWFIVGTKKYLEEKNIVAREGGFIGIGKSRKVSEEFDRSLFTMADLRDLKALPVFGKKARVLTIHPAGSYSLTGEPTIDSLRILHPDDFWSASKYLVVMID